MSILPTKFYKINPTTAILVVSNISILVLALILDWSLQGIVMTYWAENLVIGVLNIPKIIMAKQQHPGHRPDTVWSKIATIIFFCFHYVLFGALHFFIIALLFTSDEAIIPMHEKSYNALDSIEIIGVALLFISHTMSFFLNFVKKKEYQKVSPFAQMLKPYIRILIVHGYVFLGGYVLLFFDNAMVIMLTLFVLIKTLIDMMSHLKEHKKAQQ
jgi:hypothetical protein